MTTASATCHFPDQLRVEAEIWLYRMGEGRGDWHFVTLTGDAAAELKLRSLEQRRGFRSVKVRVTVGETSWITSVFPQNGDSEFILPVKRAVRRAEDLVAGDKVALLVEF